MSVTELWMSTKTPKPRQRNINNTPWQDDLISFPAHSAIPFCIVFFYHHIYITLHTLKLPRTCSSASSQLVCVQIWRLCFCLEQESFWFLARWSGTRHQLPLLWQIGLSGLSALRCFLPGIPYFCTSYTVVRRQLLEQLIHANTTGIWYSKY